MAGYLEKSETIFNFVNAMSDDRVKNAAVTALDRYLTHHRLRKTPERYTILRKVFETADHFSVEELHQSLNAEEYFVSCATVYNTIELLTKAGLVRRRNFGGQTSYYEKIAGSANHFHLVCSRCGKVKELKNSSVDTIIASLDTGTFKPAYADLYIHGVCARCARKSRPVSKKRMGEPVTTNVKNHHSNISDKS